MNESITMIVVVSESSEWCRVSGGSWVSVRVRYVAHRVQGNDARTDQLIMSNRAVSRDVTTLLREVVSWDVPPFRANIVLHH